MRAIFAISASLLIAPGCTTQTTHGYQGEFSLITLAASDPATGWSLSMTHDILWDGQSGQGIEVRCTETSNVGVRGLQFVARDEGYQQGFDLRMGIQPYGGNGQYLVDDTQAAPGLQVSVVTAEQTFDLDTSRSGSCNVTISGDEKKGDFACTGLEEHVNYVSGKLPFTLKGAWECAVIELDG